ncbi:hypothetical protein T4D_14513 [Trichinella pseudospiralis]|uniref:Uncharacterized protein n=1 Tax=Trichinella pseudospiralis TaxID=6337 RepID=A0A0V1FN81_TRIPS|nr:hypothetical protein T4D_14513 [Trichinella pseudospiralis]
MTKLWSRSTSAWRRRRTGFISSKGFYSSGPPCGPVDRATVWRPTTIPTLPPLPPTCHSSGHKTGRRQN